jgi:hypothetical protein
MMLQSVVEPILLSPEANENSRWATVACDYDLL